MAAFLMIFRGEGTGRGSPEQMQQRMQKWFDWFQGLKKAGVYQDQGAPLEAGGKVIRGTRKAVSDGPYSEKEVVGGYAIIQAKDLDAAVELARGCPTYEEDGAVEVRPVRAM